MKTIRKNTFLQTIVLFILLPAFVWMPSVVQSNPTGEIVISGDITIESDGNTMRVLQESSKSIIHWEDFSIGSGDRMIFEMPGSSSASLNRVTGSAASAIDGLLQANGSVWVINPNGIIVGPNGMIDASGAVLSTLDIDDNNFLHGGQYHFQGTSTAPITNYGKIQTADRGEIFVVAHNIQQEGYLGAPDGRIILAGGSDVLINGGPNGVVFINSTVAGGAHITHNGVSEAAEIQLLARNGNPFAMAVQINGTLRATTAANEGGRIVLQVDGPGNVNVGATAIVEASGLTGGSIDIGTDGGIQIGSPNIRANGELAGGDIRMNGGQIEFLPGAAVEVNSAAGGAGSITIGSDGTDGNAQTQTLTLQAGSTVSANGAVGGGSISMATTGTLTGAGEVNATGGAGAGGVVSFAGNDILLPQTASVDASGDSGGSVFGVAQNNMFVDGTIDAGGGANRGGAISLTAGDNLLISDTGLLSANGGQGGSINLSAVDELYIAGAVTADGDDGTGGEIHLGGTDITIAASALVSATGSDGGGMINAAASDSLNIFGTVTATGGDGSGGTIDLSATDLLIGPTAMVDAGGASGGTIDLSASDTAKVFGTVQAIGGNGTGGTINLSATDALVGPTATIDASGTSGGTVLLNASNQMDVSGTVRANGSDGTGGLIGVSAQTININSTAVLDGNGSAGGGEVHVGGGVGGRDPRFSNARTVNVASGAQVSANSTGAGNGGVISFWSDGDMNYGGGTQANGAGQVGNGGFVEVSGLGNLSLGGSVSTGASGSGRAGTFLIDPVDINIDAAAAGLITGALATSNVIIHTSPIFQADPGQNGDITVENQVHIDYNSVNSLSFFAHGDFIMDRSASIRNGGSGNINVVAGWDPGALDVAALFNNDPLQPGLVSQSHVDFPVPAAGGHVGSIAAADILAGTFGTFGTGGNGQVRFVANTDADTTAVIGSAHGETNVFGGSLELFVGNDREGAQIGWNTLTNENRTTGGVINPQLLNQDQTNFTVGNRSIYGYDAADTTVELAGGTTALVIGDTIDYGHGGGVYTVTAVDGSILTLDRGLDAAVASGAAVIVVGVGSNDHVTGVEGRNNANAGNINVHTTGLIHMAGGNRSGAQIGHGGNVRSWQPNQEGDLNGDITVRAGNVIMTSGTERFGTQIGHGGTNDSWGGNQPVQTINRSGNIDVESTGGILMAAGTRKAPVQIGHGGVRTHGNLTGDVRVVGQGGPVIMRAPQVPGDNRESWIMIGNGGYDFQGNASGDIFVEATAVQMTASSQSRDNFVMIGNGGRSVRGEHYGHISVEATNGSITATGGFGFGQTDLERNFVQIGNGGYDADHANIRPASNAGGPNGAGTTVGEEMTRVNIFNATNTDDFDDITAMIEASPFLQTALAGRINEDANGNGILDPGEDLNANGRIDTGNDVYRRLGSAGNIRVVAAGGINFRAGGDADSHAQIGHGGRDTWGAHGMWDIDNADGDNDWHTGMDGNITVIANNGGVVFDRSVIHGSTTGERSHVQIGHGGYFSIAGAQGDIIVEAHNGNVEFSGGTQDDAYAQIGHGGRVSAWGHGDTGDTAAFRNARAKHDNGMAGVLSGDIDVRATGDLIFRSGFGESDRAYSQVGHGGYSTYAPAHLGHNGDINIQTGGNVDFYAGRRNNPNHELGQDALLNGMLDRTEAGNGNVNWTGIGHITYDRGQNNPFGDITINAGINPFAGTLSLGANIAANASAFVSVEATGGWDGIGYTDDQANGNNAADDYPTFNTGANSSLNGDNNFAQIGHGGHDFDHVAEGDDRGQSGSNSIGVGALGYWWDPLTQQHVAGTINGTLDDGSSAGSVAGDGLADVSGGNNAHSTNGNDTNRLDQGTYTDDNTRGRGWVIPDVGLTALNLLDPANAAFASNISTSNINITATGDVRVVGAQFDPTNPMRRGYTEDGTRNVAGILNNVTTGDPIRDQDDLLTLFNTSRTMTTNSSVFTTQTTALVPLNLVQSARQSRAMIGHGGQSSGQRAFGANNSGLEAGYGYYGDINITAGGEVKVLAGDFIRELAPGEAPDEISGDTQYDFDGDGIGALPLYRPFDIANNNVGNNSTALNNVPQGSVDSRDNFAMIGHGGHEFSSHVRGNISIASSGGGLEVKAGNSLRSWAQVGHGGEGWNVGIQSLINVPQDIQGTIDIDVTGDIDVIAGQSTFSYAQIGHGGVEMRDDDDPNTARTDGRNNFDVDAFTVTNSDIRVISRTGDISVLNRSFLEGFFAQPQYDFANNPDVIRLNANSMLQDGIAHSMIGHGAYDSEVNVGEVIDGVRVGGNISVRAEQGNVRVGPTPNPTGVAVHSPMHWRSPMQIGHMMSHTDRTPPNTTLSLIGNIDVYAGGDISVRGGDTPRILGDIQSLRSYGQRDGAGAWDLTNPLRDDSFAFDEGSVLDNTALYYPLDIDTDEYDSYAQIGHGGSTVGSWAGRGGLVTDGDITVTANRAAAVDDPATPTIDETATAANLVLDAGDGTGAFAMIGHGGRRNRHGSGISGDITVNVSGDTFLIGGERFINGGLSGTFRRAENKANWATIGHNLQTTNERTGDARGNIVLNTGGNLTMQAGFGDGAHVRIGNGSNYNNLAQDHTGNFSGDISVTVGNDLLIRGGGMNNDGTLAGFSAQEDFPGLVSSPGGEDATFEELGDPALGEASESSPDDTYAQIGNGGNGVNGVLQGNIILNVGNNATLERGAAVTTLFSNVSGPFLQGSAIGGSVKIGHGDWLYDDPGGSGTLTREGNITIAVGSDLSLNGSMVGHVDSRVSPAIAIVGNTTISTGRNGTGGVLTTTNALHTQAAGINFPAAVFVDTGFGVSVLNTGLGGELRIYIPEHHDGLGPLDGVGTLGNLGNLDIAAGTLFNGTTYVRHSAEPAGGLFRADETLQPEIGFNFTNPDGNFENDLPAWAVTPLGLYPAHGFGNYNVYFGDTPVIPGAPVGGGGPTGGGGGGGDLIPVEDEIRPIIEDLVVAITPPIAEVVGTPVLTGLTPLQLALIRGFNSSGFQFEIGRGLQTEGEGGVGDTASPTTDNLVVFFEIGDGRIFAVSGQGTFYTTDPANPYDLTEAGEIEIVSIQEALSRRRATAAPDAANGVIDAGAIDPANPIDAPFDPFQMQEGEEEDDEEEDENPFGTMGEPAVNTDDTPPSATPAPAEAEFDF